MTPNAPSPLQPALIGADELPLVLWKWGTSATGVGPTQPSLIFPPLLPSPGGVRSTKLAKCQSDPSSQAQGSPPAGHLVSGAQLHDLNIRKGSLQAQEDKRGQWQSSALWSMTCLAHSVLPGCDPFHAEAERQGMMFPTRK